MPFRITLSPSQHQFDAETHESILEAASRSGFTLPHSCRDGVCGVCKGKVLMGSVDYGNPLASTLTEAEKSEGYALYCCAKPLSDLTLECREVLDMKEYVVKSLPCRVNKLEKLADDVMVLKLQLPANEKLNFRAGQYISIQNKDFGERHFSLANSPDDSLLELHIRQIQGGKFTGYVFNKLAERDILRFKGPLGSFFLREDSNKPIILLASGTGFAPIKSIVEYALAHKIERSIHVYWGGRKKADLYMFALAESWQQQGVAFTPVLSEALPSDEWSGRSGLVHQAILDDYADLSGYEVYVCGSPLVVEAAQRDFVAQRQLPADAIFSDAFTFSSK